MSSSLSVSGVGKEPKSRQLVAAIPSVLHFGGFKPGLTYELVVKFVNNASTAKRMNIGQPTSKLFFDAQCVKKGLVVPGFSEDVTVRFKPQELRYYYDTLRVSTEDCEVIVPIHAYPVMNDVVFPERIDLGSCMVSETARRVIPIKCKVPMPFDFTITEVLKHPDIKIRPLKGTIPGDGEVQITIEYTPTSLNMAECEISVSVSQFNFKPITCTIVGVGVSAATAPGSKKERLEKLAELRTTRDTPRAASGAPIIRGPGAEYNATLSMRSPNVQQLIQDEVVGSTLVRSSPKRGSPKSLKLKSGPLSPIASVIQTAPTTLYTTLSQTSNNEEERMKRRKQVELELERQARDYATFEGSKAVKTFVCIGQDPLTPDQLQEIADARSPVPIEPEHRQRALLVKEDLREARSKQPLFEVVEFSDNIYARKKMIESFVQMSRVILIRNRVKDRLDRMRTTIEQERAREQRTLSPTRSVTSTRSLLTVLKDTIMLTQEEEGSVINPNALLRRIKVSTLPICPFSQEAAGQTRQTRTSAASGGGSEAGGENVSAELAAVRQSEPVFDATSHWKVANLKVPVRYKVSNYKPHPHPPMQVFVPKDNSSKLLRLITTPMFAERVVPVEPVEVGKIRELLVQERAKELKVSETRLHPFSTQHTFSESEPHHVPESTHPITDRQVALVEKEDKTKRLATTEAGALIPDLEFSTSKQIAKMEWKNKAGLTTTTTPRDPSATAAAATLPGTGSGKTALVGAGPSSATVTFDLPPSSTVPLPTQSGTARRTQKATLLRPSKLSFSQMKETLTQDQQVKNTEIYTAEEEAMIAGMFKKPTADTLRSAFFVPGLSADGQPPQLGLNPDLKFELPVTIQQTPLELAQQEDAESAKAKKEAALAQSRRLKAPSGSIPPK